MVNVISKERNLGLKMFMGSMTSYPLERSVTKSNTEKKKPHQKKPTTLNAYDHGFTGFTGYVNIDYKKNKKIHLR